MNTKTQSRKVSFQLLWIGFGLLLMGLALPSKAALVVVNNDFAQVVVWRLGDSPDNVRIVDPVGDITCQATGQELLYLQQTFQGLKNRNHSGGVITWSGDDCAFIINNL